MSNPASTSASPSFTACSAVPLRAPSNIESVVTLTIPAPTGCPSSSTLSDNRQFMRLIARVARGREVEDGPWPARRLPCPAPGPARRSIRSLVRPTSGYRSDRPMALRCVYTDLDGTLLGKGSSLFRDAEGSFSLAQARGLEACDRAGVEVVIMSGRREPQVHEAARLMGQTSYIYEAGCAFAIDGETTTLTGEMVPDEDGTVYEKIERRGIPKMLFEHL